MLSLLLGLIVIEGICRSSGIAPTSAAACRCFTRRIPVSRDALACFSLAQVENAVEPSRWPELGFHRFSENVYAFRETFLFVGGVYPMIMRGRIVIDRRQRGIMMMVVGFLVPVAVIRPGETLMFSGFLVLAYLLQRSRFISVETAVHLLLQTNITPLIPRGPDASRRASAD